MDYKMLEKLKEDLQEAVKKNDTEKINEIKTILSISEEQSKYFEKGLTGYPSVDKIWLKYYNRDAEEKANDIPANKTVWDVIEEKLLEYYDVPAIEYFKKQISTQEFIDSVYTWARTFKAMGVQPDEVVPIYGPFVPDICAMTLALNTIGATSYFLKLAISPEALEEETREAKIAVVFDGMWKNVAHEFSKDKFKKVIVATVQEDMPSPKKEILSFINYIQAKKNKSLIPDDKKYIWLDEAKQIADYYTGEVKEKFVPNRNTFITSSSGTTIGGIVKGTVATNESTLVHMKMGKESGIRYFPGDRCLNSLPPTASTSLNVLFLYGLYHGMTVVIDPRVSEKDFYYQLTELKPNIALTTGSMWETFFNRVQKEMQAGKKFDFSYAKGWTIGGEGSDPQKIARWKELMEKANSTDSIFSGYGSSELFSGITVENLAAKDYTDNSKAVMNVGIPYAGINVGVFNQDGEELPYGERGELWIQSKSAMKGYYNKPEITAETLVDGWVHTGDVAEIDENGFVYIWGRTKDKIDLEDGSHLYMFDVANKLKENSKVQDAIVLSMPTRENDKSLVAHIVWSPEVEEKQKIEGIGEMNTALAQFLPEEVEVVAYSEHQGMLPYSPTTLKKDKNKLAKQTSGYIQLEDGILNQIEFIPSNDGKYAKKCDIIKSYNKMKSLRRK